MATIPHSFSALRRSTHRIGSGFFTHTLNCQRARRTPVHPFRPAQHSAFQQFFRSQTTQVPQHRSTPLEELGRTIGGAAEHTGATKSSAFPKTSEKVVAYWLLGSAASVFGIVIFGGLTRLTESGLSITEWRPVTGSRPPLTQADWELEFTKYRASPEFQLLNSRMSLDEFKKIYWMEWTHRLWGRVIGITFLVPAIYFIARRRVAAHMAWKITGICAGIGCQGAIGWWMVQSGLKDDLFAEGSHPRVSQYRLATHLGAAFLVYCSMVWTGLSILRERKLLSQPEQSQALISQFAKHPHLRKLRIAATALLALVFTTAMSGALVAGLDAGLIYNEFPWMGLGLTPPKKELFDPFYSRDPEHKDLVWRNMLENPSLVQLDHRILATTTFTSICALFAYPRFAPQVAKAAGPYPMKALTGVFHLAWMQVTLGISTLIYMVPTWLGAMHQAGALALLTGSLVLVSRLRISPRTARLVAEAAKHRAPSTHLKRGVGKAGASLEQKIV